MRKLYSKRNFGSKKPSFGVIRDLFLDFFEELKESDYLKENFGYFCVFTNMEGECPFISGKLGGFDLDAVGSIEDYFFRKLKRRIYPNKSNFKEISQEDFFDVVELVYDVISKPISKIDILVELPTDYKIDSDFSKAIAQKEYIERINEIINDFGFEMRGNGEIWGLPQQGMEKLVEEVEKAKKPQDFESKIQHAIDSFFDKNSNIESKRSSCVTLSGILESVRDDLGIPKKDENELFEMINKYGIRHQRKDQKKASKEELEWIFYTLLNTINHFLKIKK